MSSAAQTTILYGRDWKAFEAEEMLFVVLSVLGCYELFEIDTVAGGVLSIPFAQILCIKFGLLKNRTNADTRGARRICQDGDS